MGVAGLIFEPHPPNFENQYNFEDVQMMLRLFFDFSVECSVYLCSCPWSITQNNTTYMKVWVIQNQCHS